MRWIESENSFCASEEVRHANDRNEVVDEYLTIALSKIGGAYDFSDCPAIIFELWSGRLIVFDSPDGADLSRDEESTQSWDTIIFQNIFPITILKSVINLAHILKK